MRQRWAFSKKNLRHPETCKADDELVATPTMASEEAEVTPVLVQRNGQVTNRFEDGTAGVSAELQAMADTEETLYHPETNEYTDCWRDVETDDKGNFVRFA